MKVVKCNIPILGITVSYGYKIIDKGWFKEAPRCCVRISFFALGFDT
jgi:hypothetical protein